MERVAAVVIVLVALVAGASAERSKGWITLSSDGEGGYEVRVLVSADESQVALDTSGYSVMNGPQEIAHVCPVGNTDSSACDDFWMMVGEGGSQPGDDDRFAKTIADGGFEPIKLRRARGRAGKVGKLRLKVKDGVLTVRRGKLELAQVTIGDELRLSAAGTTPGGNLAVVLDGYRVILIDLP